MLHEEHKRLETERKAQEKYKEWLQKKKQEEMEKMMKEQVSLLKAGKGI